MTNPLRTHADRVIRENPSIGTKQFLEFLRMNVDPDTTRKQAYEALYAARKRTDTPGVEALPPPGHKTSTETDAERTDRIQRQYSTLDRMADRIIDGRLPALVVSGPPGLGKTYTVEQALDRANKDTDVIRGTVSAAGLYIALYSMAEGGVVVLDDCDAVFRDEEALNILKIVLDSSEKRVVSWRKRASWLEELDIPERYEYTGSVVFCTNIDFETEIQRGSKLAVHYRALIDRSLYLCLTLRTVEDYLERIQQVCIEEGVFARLGLNPDEADNTMQFIRENSTKFYTLSIRSAMQVAHCRIMDVVNWQDDVRATKMRTL